MNDNPNGNQGRQQQQYNVSALQKDNGIDLYVRDPETGEIRKYITGDENRIPNFNQERQDAITRMTQRIINGPRPSAFTPAQQNGYAVIEQADPQQHPFAQQNQVQQPVVQQPVVQQQPQQDNWTIIQERLRDRIAEKEQKEQKEKEEKKPKHNDPNKKGGHQVIPTIGQIVVIILIISIIVCTILYILKTYYSPVIIEEDVTKYKHKTKYTDSE